MEISGPRLPSASEDCSGYTVAKFGLDIFRPLLPAPYPISNQLGGAPTSRPPENSKVLWERHAGIQDEQAAAVQPSRRSRYEISGELLLSFSKSNFLMSRSPRDPHTACFIGTLVHRRANHL